jgi:hypothetical protein
LKDVIVGKIYFLLVRIKIKHMELSIIRRETTGSPPNQYNESETITKFEIMDGAPVRGETIPIRLFLGGFDLTPTFREVNKRFSVRYYLNLVLIDEENRRYFKQQVRPFISLSCCVSLERSGNHRVPCTRGASTVDLGERLLTRPCFRTERAVDILFYTVPRATTSLSGLVPSHSHGVYVREEIPQSLTRRFILGRTCVINAKACRYTTDEELGQISLRVNNADRRGHCVC